MNLIVVGVSHRTAPVDLLERLAAPPTQLVGALTALLARPYVSEAVLLSTCNRVEVYAGVTAFHGGLTDIVGTFAGRAGLNPADLAPHLYAHHESDAVRHAYRVAAGLDSMVVGEAQILGQLRDAYVLAAERDAAGRLLHELMQQALRVGKRAHSETGIDRSGQNVVSCALGVAESRLGGPLAGRSALVVGAGAMGALALATLRRAGAESLSLANRSPERAERLAAAYGAAVAPLDQLPTLLPDVDLVVSATASTGHVIKVEDLGGKRGGRPIVVLDLGVPRDVDPAVGELPGVTLLDVDGLGAALDASGSSADRDAAEAIVADEVESFLAWMRGAGVAPTVAALRARADELVEAELRRFAQRRPDLTDDQRADVARTVHRVVQRLLHQPTVRVRALAAGPDGDRYAALLRDLFDLDLPSASGVGDIPEVNEP